MESGDSSLFVLEAPDSVLVLVQPPSCQHSKGGSLNFCGTDSLFIPTCLKRSLMGSGDSLQFVLGAPPHSPCVGATLLMALFEGGFIGFL